MKGRGEDLTRQHAEDSEKLDKDESESRRRLFGIDIVRGRGAAKRVQLTAADFDRTVIYRGIKIEPMMAVGKRSPLARAIRNELRIKSEQVRGKSG